MKLLTRILALLALLLVPAAQADGLIDNVNGITLDDKGEVVRFTGILFNHEGFVTYLFKGKEKRPKKLEWRIDMQGKTMIPGMIDAHGHVMDLGFQRLSLDLSATTSLSEAQSKIAAYSASNPAKWILGGGWNQEKWALGRFPTAADLDAVVSDRPVWLERVDGHAAWANSRAMQLAGITAATRDPAGGRIERDAKGNPSGVFVDSAKALVQKVIPQPTPRDRNGAFLAAQDHLFSLGITATSDMGTSIEDWLTYRRMGDLGLLKVRIMSYGPCPPTASAVSTPRP